MSPRLFIAALFCLVAVALRADTADNAGTVKGKPRLMAQVKPKADAPAKTAPPAIDAEQEQVVLEFVREHQPELAELLTHLKEGRPKEYHKAIRDLSRARDRLFQMRKNNAARYDIELSLWKIETRVQLLAARLQMSESKELREQLRAALGEQIDARISLLKLERDQVQERLNKANAQLKKLDSERSQLIDKQLQVLTKTPARPDKDKKDSLKKP
jgi:hypothetical protein